MRATYSTTFVGLCPVDDTRDVYELTVVSDSMIPVESLLRAISEATVHSAYQEDITGNLAARLKGAAITTIGVHSGVRTVVTA